jgi:hypothetical protein
MNGIADGTVQHPDLVRGVDGSLLLTPAADTARKHLAAWARDMAHVAIDYNIHGKDDRDYHSTSLEPLVKPLLREMNLAVRHEIPSMGHVNSYRDVNTRCIAPRTLD